jgi:GT2 family glycosyltransferase
MTSGLPRYLPPDPLPGLKEVDRSPKPVLQDISVVIPTLGRPLLEKCLASILAGSHWPALIIVVHQGTEYLVERLIADLDGVGLRTCYIQSSSRGRAAGLNRGIGAVDTEYLAITDDDCVVAPDWLDRMRSVLESSSEVVMSGRVEDVGDEVSVAHALSMKAQSRSRPSLIYDTLSGGNAGMPKSIFDKVGGFDEDPRLRLAEDTEWAYRALRAGVTLAYSPEVCVWHYAWRNRDEGARQYRGYALSHGSYYGKYIRRGDLFIALKAMVHLARSVRRWARGTVRRDPNMTAHGKAYSLGLIPGVIRGFRKPETTGRS